MPEIELTDLAQGLAEQAIKTDDFKNLLDLNQKDKSKIIQSKPTSIQELKIRVQQLLMQKSKENNIEQEIHFDPAYDISDPDLVQAARLGKHALRDQRMMVMLWNKFQNQNKIAAFLGVNRSSVNRRCREYNLSITCHRSGRWSAKREWRPLHSPLRGSGSIRLRLLTTGLRLL